MMNLPIDAQSGFVSLANDRPHPIEVRRALKIWALDKPQQVKLLVNTICGQMWALERITHPAARKVAAKAIAANMKRLGGAP